MSAIPEIIDSVVKLSRPTSILVIIVAFSAFLVTSTIEKGLFDKESINQKLIEQKFIALNNSKQDHYNKEIIRDIQKSLLSLKTEVKIIEASKIAKASTFPPPKLDQKFITELSKKIVLQIPSTLKSTMNKVSKRLRKIEQFILATPETVLSIPLLKRDLQDINNILLLINKKILTIDQLTLSNEKHKAEIGMLKGSISTLNGFIFALFLALLTGAIPVIVKIFQKKEST